MSGIVLFFVLFTWLGPWAAPLEIPTSAADVTFTVEDSLFSGLGPPSLSAGGDFNGDGINDLVFGTQDINIFLGGPLPRTVSVGQDRDFHIEWPSSRPPLTVFVDLDGDGRDDLVAFDYINVSVFYGQDPPGKSIDLSVISADLTLTGFGGFALQRSPLASGHVDGDRYGDLLIGDLLADPLGRVNAGAAYLFRGGPVRRKGTFDVTTSTHVITFQGVSGGLGSSVALGDVNGDGKDDVILSAPQKSVSGRTQAGEIYMLFGQDTFPPVCDLAGSTAVVRILGAVQNDNIACSAAGDLSGDGLAEMIFFKSTSQWAFLLAGVSISSFPAIIDLLTQSPTVVQTNGTLWGSVLGDFDGDSRKDLLVLNGPEANLFLSEQLPLGATLPAVLSTASVKILAGAGDFYAGGLGDINGDGRDDVALTESPNTSPSSFLGVHHVIYGFRPLRDPGLRVVQNAPGSPRVTLELWVEGDVTEMQLSGDLIDEVKDRWIPFQRALAVDIVPGEGRRTVRATFRNAFGRESETIIEPLSLSAGEAGIVDVTTVVHPQAEGKVRIDCHLTSPGRVKASVFSTAGDRMTDLMDEEKGPGVWPIRWDGRNATGGRVSPGIYFLMIEVNGRVERRRVVVRG